MERDLERDRLRLSRERSLRLLRASSDDRERDLRLGLDHDGGREWRRGERDLLPGLIERDLERPRRTSSAFSLPFTSLWSLSVLSLDRSRRSSLFGLVLLRLLSVLYLSSALLDIMQYES